MHINRDSPSPNFGPRPTGVSVDMLVLHYTGMKTGQEALERLCDPAAQVSAHYLVEEDGQIFQLVAEQHRAWHAGLAFWQGETDINSCSIGIEIVNPGHEWGYRPFPAPQMIAVTALCKDILARHAIPAQKVLAHSDIAPERKEDPGELFDWQQLNHAGIGIYPNKALKPEISETPGPELSFAEQESFLRKLSDFGYAVKLDAPDHPATKSALIAFQRHFRQQKLDGVIDRQCCQILDNLHSQLDG